MKVNIKPSKCSGKVRIPPSKSMAHRTIICACLANGKSVISNIDYSVDILTTIECMRNLGAEIECEKDFVVINGIKDFNSLRNNEIQCNESGSTLRFLIPLFSLTNQKIIFKGKNRLLKRPQKIYEDIFNSLGLYFYQDDEKIEIEGSLKANEYSICGNVSSQFISGLLFTLPLLKEDSKINILPPVESKSYIYLTIEMLKKFGIEIIWQDDFTLFIKGNQKYIPHNEVVEGDFSQFAFFGVMACINSKLNISGMDQNSLQGDKQILDVLKDFGCDISFDNGAYTVSADNLEAREIDIKNCPDLGPVLCILAMFSKGKTVIHNVSRLRIKESDRIQAMVTECGKMGCKIQATQNEMIIEGGFSTPTEELSGWNDHRIVMACAVALSRLGGTINGCEAITKSYPNFFEDLKLVGIDLETYE